MSAPPDDHLPPPWDTLRFYAVFGWSLDQGLNWQMGQGAIGARTTWLPILHNALDDPKWRDTFTDWIVRGLEAHNAGFDLVGCAMRAVARDDAHDGLAATLIPYGPPAPRPMNGHDLSPKPEPSRPSPGPRPQAAPKPF